MKIIWSRHAQERQREWEKKLGITLREVEEILKNPQQIVPGYRSAQVAQTKRGNGLLRVPFVEEAGEVKVLTLYWTSKVQRYWREAQDEDSI